MALLCVATVADAAPVWERIAQPSTELSDPSTSSERYEVKIGEQEIILTIHRKTSVKVFTILGQLVADTQLDAGIWRLPIKARGIYILKVGTQTRRITL